MAIQTPLMFLLLLVVSANVTAQTTQCKCRQHPSEAEASGTCSRTEDPNYCTLKFSTTTPQEYLEFVSRLSKDGIGPPRDALVFASQNAAQNWKPSDIATHLPSLFAVSQRTTFQDQTARVAVEIREAAKNETFIGAFVNGKREATVIRLKEFEATVSLGCVELRRDKLFTMVKTQWSEAKFFCNDF